MLDFRFFKAKSLWQTGLYKALRLEVRADALDRLVERFTILA